MSLSPSSRRAWIEIKTCTAPSPASWVALLAEGVDRNNGKWHFTRGMAVALLAEGVDRNGCCVHICLCVFGRPPRGGRG